MVRCLVMNSLNPGLRAAVDREQPSVFGGWASLGDALRYLQIALTNFDILGLANGTVMNLGLLVSLFHSPLPTTQRRSDYMESTIPLRVRISRFLEERYVHRAQPHYFPELALFAVIVVVAAWPMFSLPALMETLR